MTAIMRRRDALDWISVTADLLRFGFSAATAFGFLYWFLKNRADVAAVIAALIFAVAVLTVIVILTILTRANGERPNRRR